MKIAFHANIFSKTGEGVLVRNLLQNLLDLQMNDKYISIMASSRRKEEHKNIIRTIDPTGSIEPFTIPIPGKLFQFSQSNLHFPPLNLLTGKPFDVFHQMWLTNNPVVPSNKLVVSMHDVISLVLPEEEEQLFSKAKIVLRRAAKIVTISDYSKKTIIEAFDIDPEKIKVIYCGYNPELFGTFYPEEIKNTLRKLNINVPYLFYVGGQSPRKNIPRLIKAFSLLKQKASIPHKLLLAGPFEVLKPEVAVAIQESGFLEDIVILGFLPTKVLPHLYSGADALVFPSLYEGFGLPVLEAMACGTPVVTSNTTSLPEVAGEAGLLIDPESIEEIAEGIFLILNEDLDIKRQRRDLGILQAQKFSWRRCAEQHMEVYKAVASNSNI